MSTRGVERWGRRWLAVVLVLAAVEWIAAARAYRTTITAEDWSAVRAHVATRPGWVLAGTAWLDPALRANLPAATAPDVLGHPDVRGAPGRWIVSANGDALADQTPIETIEFGGLRLDFLPASTERIVDRLEAGSLRVRGPRGACRPRGGGFDCRPGRVESAFVEVDYAPRRCLAIRGVDGQTVSLTSEVRLGSTLVGHVGFGDFNARLRSDSPARVELAVDGEVVSRFVVSDDQGWAEFEVPTPDAAQSPVELQLRITSALAGTFGPDGAYAPRSERALCVEVRTLAGGAPS